MSRGRTPLRRGRRWEQQGAAPHLEERADGGVRIVRPVDLRPEILHPDELAHVPNLRRAVRTASSLSGRRRARHERGCACSRRQLSARRSAPWCSPEPRSPKAAARSPPSSCQTCRSSGGRWCGPRSARRRTASAPHASTPCRRRSRPRAPSPSPSRPVCEGGENRGRAGRGQASGLQSLQSVSPSALHACVGADHPVAQSEPGRPWAAHHAVAVANNNERRETHQAPPLRHLRNQARTRVSGLI